MPSGSIQIPKIGRIDKQLPMMNKIPVAILTHLAFGLRIQRSQRGSGAGNLSING